MSYYNKTVYRSRNLEALAGKTEVVEKIVSTCGMKAIYSRAVIDEAQKLMKKVGNPERYQSLERLFDSMKTVTLADQEKNQNVNQGREQD